MDNIAISPMDAAWLLIEKREAPAHFGPLIFMRIPEREPDFIKNLVREWRQCRSVAPPFSYRLAKGLIPRWQIVSGNDLDMEYHLMHVALPAPGGEQELGSLISRLHSHPLHRSKPLWQVYVIEGLANNKFVIYIKLHHSQLDGMAAAELMGRTFSVDEGMRNMAPPWSIGLSSNSVQNRQKKYGDYRSFAKRLSREAAGAANIARVLAMLGRESYIERHGALFAPYQGPKSLLNSRISKHRRYATQRFELAELKQVADRASVTINDVFLSVTGGALRRYLKELDALPEHPLVGQIPINIRLEEDGRTGNALSFSFATLGTDIEDSIMRLRAVHESVQSGKSLQAPLGKGEIKTYTAIVLAPYIAETVLNLGGRFRPSANLVISNVHGPQKRLYYNGARIEHIYGPSVLFHGQALNITMASYVDEVNIGYTGCRDTLPSLQKIAVYTREAFDDLARKLN